MDPIVFNEIGEADINLANNMNVKNGALIKDNASIHKTDEVKLRLKGNAFQLLFLSLYSP